MYLIGLCGKSGSGKSAVAKIMRSRGIYTIDADSVCHRIYSENKKCISELVRKYGSDIISHGAVDRAALAKKVFSENCNVNELNAIVHKYIIDEILSEAKGAFLSGKKYVVVDAPTLFESGLNKKCDAIITVLARNDSTVQRLLLRDNIGLDKIKARHRVQISNKQLTKSSDALIVNDGSIADLRKKTFLAMLIVQLRLSGTCRNKGGAKYKIKGN